jgi:hypothetical protein
MLKTVIDYPKWKTNVWSRQNKGSYEKVNPVVSVEQICAQEAVREVYMDEK